MKRKTVSILAIALVLGLTISGCAKTPDQALVAQKNNERLEEAAKEEPKDGTSLKEVAATTTSIYDFSYSSEDGRLSIQADQVPVTLPVRDTIPMYHVNCGEIPQELTDKVYDYFFPDGAYKITGTDFTKDKYAERILEVEQTIAKVRDDSELSEAEKAEIIQRNEELIEDYQEYQSQAPEVSTLKLEPKDSAYEEEIYGTVSGEKAVKSLSVTSEDQSRWLSVTSENAHSPISSSLYYSDSSNWNYDQDVGTPIALCSDNEMAQIGITLEDATAIVQNFTKKIGMNWEIHDAFCVKGYTFIANDEDGEMLPCDHYTGFQFVLVQNIDGIQSAATSSDYVPDDDSAVTWLYEQIFIIVEADGIVELKWDYPLEVEDTVSDNVGIISFDAARDIFETMMPLTAQGDLEQWSKEEYLEVKAAVTVSDVRLGLMRVRNSGSDRTGLMTPVWLFYGDYARSFHYLPGNPMLEYGAEDYAASEPHPWILLAINAVDGSVIDITEGY